jgi:type II secretory pathway pseudopilin PulG
VGQHENIAHCQLIVPGRKCRRLIIATRRKGHLAGWQSEQRRKAMKVGEKNESGFTLIEVAVASVITMVGLVFLASLFPLAMAQNHLVKQETTATALAQQKLEEINAVDPGDFRLDVGGGLTEATKANNYFDTLYVNPDTGVVTTVIPQGSTPIYDRYWMVENDSSLNNTVLITVRVKARQQSMGKTDEETTLTTVRSW